MTHRLAAVTITIALALVTGAASAQSEAVGSWQGVLGPGVLDLAIRVTIDAEGDSYVGTIDIPAQGLIGFALDPVVVDGEMVAFAMPGIPGAPRFEGTLAVDRIEGTFTQSGQALPFFLERGDAVDARPQTPRPPFPYLEEEVTFPSDGVTLAGTLTLPPGDGRAPGMVLITGSGPQDRDEEIVGHRPFLLLADRLTRAGYAVLRVDDRGVGGSTGSDALATFDDLAADVGAALDLVMAHPRVDATRVGLLGHSQGGYIAPLVAAQRGDVAFVVLVAGPAVPGFDVLLLQNELLIERTLRAQGAPDAVVAGAVADQVAFLGELKARLDADEPEDARALVRARIEDEFAALPASARPAADQLEAIVEAQQEATLAPVFRAFLDFDPRPYLERLTVPTLTLFGGLDFQVPPEQNEAAMRELLAAAGNADATVITFEGMNHLMQPAVSGLVDEYGTIEVTIDERVIDTILAWLDERVPTE